MKLVGEDPHELPRVLSRVPCGAFQVLVPAHVTVVDICLAGPVGAGLRARPPPVKAPTHIVPIGQNLGSRRPRRRHPIVCRRLQRDAVLVLEESVNNIEEMPRQLGVGARSTRQLITEVVFRNLLEKARRCIEHDPNAPRQLGGGQVFDGAQIDANQTRNGLERLAVHPIPAARNDGQLSRPQRQQLIERTLVRQDVAR